MGIKNIVCKNCSREANVPYSSGGIPRYCSTICRKEYRRLAHKKYRENNKDIRKKYNRDRSRFLRCNSITGKEGALKILVRAATSRSKKKNIECTISYSFMENLYYKQGGVCAKTGVVLTPSTGKGIGNKSPYTISIDRIDPTIGYIESNVQLVCWWYNVSKATWSDNTVLDFSIRVISYDTS